MRIHKRHHALHGFLLIAGLLLPSFARAQGPSDYAARARKAIEDDLRKSGKSPGEFRIEIVADAGLVAGHALLHRRVTPLRPGRATLSGRVVNSGWEVVSGVRLTLVAESNAEVALSAVTSRTGEFQFPDVAPGEYQLLSSGSATAKRFKLAPGYKRTIVPLDGSEYYSLFDAADTRPPATSAIVYRGNKLEQFQEVRFNGDQPSIETIDLTHPDSIDTDFGVESLPTDAELKQLKAQFEPMLAALLDVARSPERLRPFLSSRVICRVVYSGGRLIPSIDERRCALNLLDSIAFNMWFRVEGPDAQPRSLALDWYDEPHGATEEQLFAAALRKHEILRSELRDAGMFEREHASRVQQYFRNWFAGIPLIRVTVTEPDPELPLPKGELFMTPFGCFLIREGGELRIVAVLQAGG